MSGKKTIISTKYPTIKVETQSNKNLFDFYSTYPPSYYDDNYMTQWSQYANAPMATEIQNELYPVLRKELAGLSEYECVSRILNWVQTGFAYEYDKSMGARQNYLCRRNLVLSLLWLWGQKCSFHKISTRSYEFRLYLDLLFRSSCYCSKL